MTKRRLFVVGVAIALMAGTPAIAATDAEIQEITRQCVALVHQQGFPRFDAYFDSGDHYWHTLQNDESIFYFRKCLVQRGLSPE